MFQRRRTARSCPQFFQRCEVQPQGLTVSDALRRTIVHQNFWGFSTAHVADPAILAPIFGAGVDIIFVGAFGHWFGLQLRGASAGFVYLGTAQKIG